MISVLFRMSEDDWGKVADETARLVGLLDSRQFSRNKLRCSL